MSCNEFDQNEQILCTKIIDCNVESIVTTSTLLEEAVSFTSFHSLQRGTRCIGLSNISFSLDRTGEVRSLSSLRSFLGVNRFKTPHFPSGPSVDSPVTEDLTFFLSSLSMEVPNNVKESQRGKVHRIFTGL